MKVKENEAKRNDAVEAFERAVQEVGTEHYVLRLYVTGTTPKSLRAIENIKKICEEHLEGRYELEVIDIYQKPALARGEEIIAVPTLVKKLPLPLRRFIGDLSDTEHVLFGLDVKPKE
jgi:circadian clock protein KaiB